LFRTGWSRSASISAREPYEGGTLEIADIQSKAVLHTVANRGAGDAIIFRVSPPSMHRVTPVGGAISKVAYAGWFRSQPSFSHPHDWSQKAPSSGHVNEQLMDATPSCS